MLTLEELNKLVTYSEEDKTFPLTWKVRDIDNSGFNKTWAGTKCGCMTTQGYVHLSIRGKVYKLHRLVYMLKEGLANTDLIPDSIDHIDRDTTNNLKKNLRDGSTDSRNSKINSRNRTSLGSSKYIGVNISDKSRNKFSASISVNFEEVFLINYSTETYAAELYKAACKYLDYEVDNIYNTVKDITLPKGCIDKIELAKKMPVKTMKSSKYQGVTWSRQKGKYVTRIHIYTNGKSKNISVGYYEDDLEAAIRRDLCIIENGYTNPLVIITEEQYNKYREIYPQHKVKRLYVKLLDTGEERFYSAQTPASEDMCIDKKRIRKYLLGEDLENFPYHFEWKYFEKGSEPTVIKPKKLHHQQT